ncbi:MAG: nucleotidyltransferase domain-containing protein [Candidatus Binataceae bacterium]
MNQAALIERIKTTLQPDRRVRALFLTGSFGCGTADRYSDVDLLLITDPGRQEEFLRSWPDILGSISEVVFWQRPFPAAPLLNAITSEWLRCDLLVFDPHQIKIRSQKSLKVLLDESNLYATLPADDPMRGGPGKLGAIINEFIRVFGLCPVAIGREEYVVAVTGAGLLRTSLIQLFLEENGIRDAAALHLKRLLTAEQLDVLEKMPGVKADRESVIEASLNCARIFLPRAKQLAHKLSVPWPASFEAATLRHLNKELGIQL